MMETEWFRAGVGLVVVNSSRLALAFERADVPDAWQLPQGGLEAGEDWVQAAWRELGEETSLTDGEVELTAVSKEWTVYELPAQMRNHKTGRGQIHKWFLFRLCPEIEERQLPGMGVEFQSQKWMSAAELIDKTISFRRRPYKRVAEWFAEYWC